MINIKYFNIKQKNPFFFPPTYLFSLHEGPHMMDCREGIKTPCCLCRGMGSIPGRGPKVPHAEGGKKVSKCLSRGHRKKASLGSFQRLPCTSDCRVLLKWWAVTSLPCNQGRWPSVTMLPFEMRFPPYSSLEPRPVCKEQGQWAGPPQQAPVLRIGAQRLPPACCPKKPLEPSRSMDITVGMTSGVAEAVTRLLSAGPLTSPGRQDGPGRHLSGEDGPNVCL